MNTLLGKVSRFFVAVASVAIVTACSESPTELPEPQATPDLSASISGNSFGLHVSGAALTSDAAFDGISYTGVGWVRIPVGINDLLPNRPDSEADVPNKVNYTYLQNNVLTPIRKAQARNIQVLLSWGDQVPSWLAPSGGGAGINGALYDRWRGINRFLGEAVRDSVGGYVRHFSLWNEPDAAGISTGDLVTISAYAVDGLHSADNTYTIVSPEFTDANYASSYLSSAGYMIDIVAGHWYQPAGGTGGVIGGAGQFANLTTKEFWLTEVGHQHDPGNPASTPTDAQQAEALAYMGYHWHHSPRATNWTKSFFFKSFKDGVAGVPLWGIMSNPTGPVTYHDGFRCYRWVNYSGADLSQTSQWGCNHI